MATGQPQPQGSLDSYAMGLNQVNLDLQRQTNAYAYLKQMMQAVQFVAQQPPTEQLSPEQLADLPKLPVLMLRVPPVDPKQQQPDIVELDLNTFGRAEQGSTLAVFQGFTDAVAQKLLQAWDNVHNIDGAANRIVQNARQQLVGPPHAAPPATQPAAQMGLPPQGQAGA